MIDLDKWHRFIVKSAHTIHSKLPLKIKSIIEANDLMQEGYAGFLEYTNKIDGPTNEEFDRRLRVRIKGSMIDYLKKFDNLTNTQRRLARQIEKLMDITFLVDDRHKASKLGLSLEVYQSYRDISKIEVSFFAEKSVEEASVVSIENCVYEEDKAIPSAEYTLELASLQSDITNELKKLSDLQRNIISNLFFDGMTLQEAADKMGISPTVAREIYRSAISDLKIHLNSKKDLAS